MIYDVVWSLCQWYLIRIYYIGGNWNIYIWKPWQRQISTLNWSQTLILVVCSPNFSSLLSPLVVSGVQHGYTSLLTVPFTVSNVPHKCRGSHQVMCICLLSLGGVFWLLTSDAADASQVSFDWPITNDASVKAVAPRYDYLLDALEIVTNAKVSGHFRVSSSATAHCGYDCAPNTCWKYKSGNSGPWCWIQPLVYCEKDDDCDSNKPCTQATCPWLFCCWTGAELVQRGSASAAVHLSMYYDSDPRMKI